MRLFFAFWPEAAEVEMLAEWVERAHGLYGGRRMRPDTLHLTLAFLGPCSESRALELAEACRQWVLPAGEMLLARPGTFPRARVVWVGPETGEGHDVSWLFRANTLLWEHLAPLGWLPGESTFRPHVSLLRNAPVSAVEALQGPAVRWVPRRCSLVASNPSSAGSHYTHLAELPLWPADQSADG